MVILRLTCCEVTGEIATYTILTKNNGLWYERQGDYYIPCLTLPAEEEQPIGLWGQRHLRYIKERRKALYTSLWLSGKLNSYLVGIDQRAEAMLSQLVEQMAQRQGVTEQLKASNQMAWIGRMKHPGIGNRDRGQGNYIRIKHSGGGEYFSRHFCCQPMGLPVSSAPGTIEEIFS